MLVASFVQKEHPMTPFIEGALAGYGIAIPVGAIVMMFG
jgi:hypothetical protein